MILTELDHGATLRSVEQVVTMFEVFQNPGHAQVLFLWWNAAFLYTLLAEIGGADSDSALPMGLCLLCQGKHPRHCMETIFQWYGDPVISLGDDADRFQWRLGQRKDQPLLIKDDVTSVQNEETGVRENKSAIFGRKYEQFDKKRAGSMVTPCPAF